MEQMNCMDLGGGQMSPAEMLGRFDSCADPFPMALAMAYVRYQEWGTTYDPTTALHRGTLFPDLDKPFIGEEALNCGRKQ